MAIQFFRGPCGALLCEEPIAGLTQTLYDHNAAYYGGKYFIGETISDTAAKKIAEAFGGILVEKK